MSKKSLLIQETGFDKITLSSFDTVGLIAMSISMFIAGVLGDIYNPKYIIAISLFLMSISSLSLGLVGLFEVQNKFAFYPIFIGYNFGMSLGWPNLIQVIGNWTSPSSRGLVVGLWVTSCNIGNILGIQIASALLQNVFHDRWYYLQLSISILFFVQAILIMSFLVVSPEQVRGLTGTDLNTIAQQDPEFDSDDCSQTRAGESCRISFIGAWKLPRVILYASTLFLVKSVTTSILMWLPLLLKDFLKFEDRAIANIASMFDVGAIFGSFILGFLSDKLFAKRSPIAFLGVILSAALAFTLRSNLLVLTQIQLTWAIFLLGFLVSGLNNIITASCAIDIGKQTNLKTNQRSLSTVSGIMDGSGNFGSAMSQLTIGYSVTYLGWEDFMLIIAILISMAVLPLSKIVIEEIKEIILLLKNRKNFASNHFF